MTRFMNRSLVDALNLGAPVRPWVVQVSEGPKVFSERTVTGYVDGGYLSASVEQTGEKAFTVRGFLRGQPMGFRITTAHGYRDLSTSVPELDHRTAEAIWRVVAKELSIAVDP